jgi:hypothetical protein
LGWAGGAGTGSVITVTANQNSGLIQVKSKKPNGECMAAASLTVTVPPPINVNPTSTTICKGQSTTLMASGASSYSWYAPPGTSTFSTSINVVVTPTAFTTYTVKGKTPLGSCTYSKTISVSVNPSPTVSILCTNPSCCVGGSTGRKGLGASSYTWYPAPTSTLANITRTPVTTTTYTLVGKAANGCTNQALQTVTVYPNPTVTALANPSVVCAGVPSTLSASGASFYAWSPGGFFGSPVTTTVSGNTIYTVTGFGANSCTSIATTTVLTLSTPSVTVSPPLICSGIPNTLTAVGALNYTWTLGGASPSVIVGTPSIVVNLTSTMPYTVCGSGANTCVACFSGTLSPGSTIPLTIIGGDFCLNAATCTNVIASSSFSGPVSYTWTPNNGSPSTTGSVLTICQPSYASVYQVSVSSPVGCPYSDYVKIRTTTQCCAQSTTGLTVLTGPLSGSYTNNSYLLTQDLLVGADTWFQNAEVWVMPNVGLMVQPNVTLDLDHTHLFSCGINMWSGITVQDGGHITTDPNNTRFRNSLIEDALTGIRLDGPTAANNGPSSQPPINIQRVIFNRNFVGIRVANSDTLIDSLALGIAGCIFTSRQIPYTTYLNMVPLWWPSSSNNPFVGGLKVPTTPTTGLISPFTFSNYPQINLKQPYTWSPGHIGIQIENMGAGTIYRTPHVQFQVTYRYIKNDFNLFDGLNTGIEVTDASLFAHNNFFQDMIQTTYNGLQYGGNGIEATATGLKNMRIYLTGQDKSDGHAFWNCINGIKAQNVYQLWLRYNLFRSSHQAGGWVFPMGTQRGDYGVNIETNRFEFTAQDCEFNNLRKGIDFRTPLNPGNYYDEWLNYSAQGIFARAFVVGNCYFGAEVNSTTPYSGGGTSVSEYMEEALHIQTPNTVGWQNSASLTSMIVSNKVDRAYNGFLIDGSEDHQLWVGGNSVHIDDNLLQGGGSGSADLGYGISVKAKTDNLLVNNNTVTAVGSLNTSVTAIYCENISSASGNPNPQVLCNWVSDSWKGFEFSGPSPNTQWEGNQMCNDYYGLYLSNNGIIGQQGSPSAGSGNVWNYLGSCNPWSSPNALIQTFCDFSDPSLSPLYVVNLTGTDPIYNSGNVTGWNYSTLLGNLHDGCTSSTYNDCLANYGYGPGPNWRPASETNNTIISSKEVEEYNDIKIYPNPTNGLLTVKGGSSDQNVFVKVFDLTGRLLVDEKLSNQKTEITLDINYLPPAVYLIELQPDGGKALRKKLIKTD